MKWRWLVALLACGACKKAAETPVPPAPAAPKRVELVALASAPLTIDGHLDEPVWTKTRSSGPFLAEGTRQQTSPHSEVRAAWTPTALVLGLYAADEDQRGDDAFVVALKSPKVVFTVKASARGTLECMGCSLPKGVKAAVDTDGTLDQPNDDDEEWAVELEVPWAALGLEAPAEVELNVWRTDTPKGAAPRTTVWAERREAYGVLRLAKP